MHKWFRAFLPIFFLVLCFLESSHSWGNPLPFHVDENYESTPLLPNPESNATNCTVFFTQEVINVTFDSSFSHMNALYTFKNNASPPIEIGILLPFGPLTLYTVSQGEFDVELLHAGQEIDFKWVNRMEIEEIPFYENNPIIFYCGISFNLSFTSFEEITIQALYSRDLRMVERDEFSFLNLYYDYSYLVGTARAWNRSLDSAYFEFWVPKNITGIIPKSNELLVVREVDNYYILSIEYLDWTPSKADDVISLAWNTGPEKLDSVVIFLVILPFLILFLIFLLKKLVSSNITQY
jgi:hypothetical protein